MRMRLPRDGRDERLRPELPEPGDALADEVDRDLVAACREVAGDAHVDHELLARRDRARKVEARQLLPGSVGLRQVGPDRDDAVPERAAGQVAPSRVADPERQAERPAVLDRSPRLIGAQLHGKVRLVPERLDRGQDVPLGLLSSAPEVQLLAQQLPHVPDGPDADEQVQLDVALHRCEPRLRGDLLQVLRVERRLERAVHLHLLDQLPLSFGAVRRLRALADVDAPTGDERSPDHFERGDLVVEVVHRVEEDRRVEPVLPGHVLHGHGVELGARLGRLPDWAVDRGDALPCDLDHVLGDVDPGHLVAAARQKLAEPAGPAADVEDPRAEPQTQLLDDVRERPQSERQLLRGRRVERLRAQPEPPRWGQLLDIAAVPGGVILADVLEPSGRCFDGLLRHRTRGYARVHWPVVTVYTDLFRYRDLFLNLFRRELRVKYRGSTLGVAWTLINPIVLMLAYWLVFSVIVRAVSIQHYPLFLLTGLLVWLFFQSAIQMACSSLLGHASLVKQVRLPRQLLPFSVVATNL